MTNLKGSLPSPTDEAMDQMGKTLPAGDLSLCFSEAYGDPRLGRVGLGGPEIAGQVEVAFRYALNAALERR